MSTWAAAYVAGVVVWLMGQLVLLAIAVQNGSFKLHVHSNKERFEMVLHMFYQGVSAAAVWPLTMAMMVYQAAKTASTKELPTPALEHRKLKMPSKEKSDKEFWRTWKVVGDAMNKEFLGQDVEVDSVPVAQALMGLAWFQIWNEFEQQSLTKEEARVFFRAAAEAVSRQTMSAYCGRDPKGDRQ